MARVNERGSVLVWMVVVVGLAALSMIWIGRSGAEVVDAGAVQSVADLTALAGVDGGRSASVGVARGNHAVLVTWSRAGDRVTVRVERDGMVAVAFAAPGSSTEVPPS